MFLSFIIPVFNSKEYVEECVHTICGSSLGVDEYEIIIVDDDSTDGSDRLCRQLAKNHKNISYCHQRHSGPATARNRGLEQAHGDFVWFVDADDSVHADILPRLRDIFQQDNDVDLITFCYNIVYPDHEEYVSQGDCSAPTIGLLHLQKKERPGKYLWNHIYRRKAIGTHRFLDGVSHIEDYCFNAIVMARFKKVITLSAVGYSYNRCNLRSISHNRCLRDRIKANRDSFLVYQTLHREMESEEDQQVKDFLDHELRFNIASHLFTITRFDNARTLMHYINQYKTMGYYPLKRSGNRKADLFAGVANSEWLLRRVMVIGKRLKK